MLFIVHLLTTHYTHRVALFTNTGTRDWDMPR